MATHDVVAWNSMIIGHVWSGVSHGRSIETISADAVWKGAAKALLGACRIHGEMEMGEHIAKRVLELNPENVEGYVLLWTIYAAAAKWDLWANILNSQMSVKKDPGQTWIEVNSEVHTFPAVDEDHP
jgi:hypothetical protein